MDQYQRNQYDADQSLAEKEDYVEQKQRNERDSSAGKLFVGGVPWETTEDLFANYFSKYGEIVDSVLMKDKYSGRPRGFGFVTFADPAVAEEVLQEEHIIDGRTVEVKRTVPREEPEGSGEGRGLSRTKKIFVGGLPLSLTEDDLREYFSSYGTIIEHQIMLDRNTGRSRGFGFVTFEHEEAVEKIMLERQNHEIGGKRVEIKNAEPKRGGDGSSFSSSYGSYRNNSSGYGGGYNPRGGNGGTIGRGYGADFTSQGFNSYGGSYGGSYPGFYGAYGGYGGFGYGFGFGGPMYYNGGYAGNSYGMGANFAGMAGYGSGKGCGNTNIAGGSGKGYENGGGNSKGYENGGGSSKGYENGGGGYGRSRGSEYGGGGYYGSSKSFENGGRESSKRFHPYQK